MTPFDFVYKNGTLTETLVHVDPVSLLSSVEDWRVAYQGSTAIRLFMRINREQSSSSA